MSDEIVKVKVGVPDGPEAEFTASEGFPEFLVRLIPWFGRNDVKRGITLRILEKVQGDEVISRADADFIAAHYGEAEAAYLRRLEIAHRARKLAETDSVPLLASGQPPPSSPGSQPSGVTADEWLRRFWDDAGAVSDDLLGEVYARILTSEAKAPGSCSMRTLRTLRYLDRATCEQFAKVMPYVVNHSFVVNHGDALPYDMMMDLDDAGLLDSSGFTSWQTKGRVVHLKWGGRLFRLAREDTAELAVSLPNYPLSVAGRELARIAHVEHDQRMLSHVVQWILSNVPAAAKLYVTDLPPDWNGTGLGLSWVEIPRST